MSLNIFGMAGGAMDAQSKRLALAVENIANADVLAGDQGSLTKLNASILPLFCSIKRAMIDAKPLAAFA